MPFQQTINRNPPLGVEGQFASVSNTHNVLAGTGALVAGDNGAYIGRFAWANLDTKKATYTKATGANIAIGFVGRGSNAGVIYNWLEGASMLIPAGYGVTLFDRGDFWVKTKTVATVGQSVFASDTTGEISTGAAGATIAGSTEVPNFKVASAGIVGALIKISAF
jgi:hypothetical protein